MPRLIYPIILILLFLNLSLPQAQASLVSISYKKIEKLYSRGKYEKVLEQIKILEANKTGKDGRPKYSYRNDPEYYHYKLSSRIMLNKIVSWKESITLYDRLLQLDTAKQFAGHDIYLKLNNQIRQVIESSVEKNQLNATRLFVNALARQGDTVAAYKKVYPTKETLNIATREALTEFIKGYDYSQIDQKALAVKRQLSIENQVWALTKDLCYDFEKIRAIYIWIVHNISYDYSFSIYDGITAFKKGKGVCSAFSYLFKDMCLKAGIKAYRVTGKADGTWGWGGHAWNKVDIEGHLFLIESTWASCVKERTNYYYLISEKEIARTHKAEAME